MPGISFEHKMLIPTIGRPQLENGLAPAADLVGSGGARQAEDQHESKRQTGAK